jgi:hypothetical protein
VTLVVIADLRRRFGLRDLEPTTETTMTDERMALIELVEKQADGDLVREMLAVAAERIMEGEVKARTGAAKGARSPMRAVQRNGSRDRDWDTRTGRIALEIPKYARGAICPVSWSRVARRRRPCWPSSRRPTSTASRRARSTIWSRPWARLASPRARSVACVRRATSG